MTSSIVRRKDNSIRWVLEAGAFRNADKPLEDAIVRARYRVTQWDDDWWASGCPRFAGEAVVFHGSLGNADRVRSELPWRPGSYCDTASFCCSAWYPRTREWLIHRNWRVMPADELAGDPDRALEFLACPEFVFIRPDSPLKPFSGRVLAREKITLASLDHGFYYDDPSIPVVIAPVRSVTREWRYVIVDRHVVAGSAYAADGRAPVLDTPEGEPWSFARQIAASLDPPEAVYVIDVCEVDGQLALLEINPFSGADLYACDADAVVAAVSNLAIRHAEGG